MNTTPLLLTIPQRHQVSAYTYWGPVHVARTIYKMRPFVDVWKLFDTRVPSARAWKPEMQNGCQHEYQAARWLNFTGQSELFPLLVYPANELVRVRHARPCNVFRYGRIFFKKTPPASGNHSLLRMLFRQSALKRRLHCLKSRHKKSDAPVRYRSIAEYRELQ
jgi:hypothetical protein